MLLLLHYGFSHLMSVRGKGFRIRIKRNNMLIVPGYFFEYTLPDHFRKDPCQINRIHIWEFPHHILKCKTKPILSRKLPDYAPAQLITLVEGFLLFVYYTNK